MGNSNTTPTRRVYLKLDGLFGQPFSIKIRADINVGQLLEVLSAYLENIRVTDVGIGAQFLIYNETPLDDSRRVSSLFPVTNSKYFNGRENPILFRDYSHVLWVKVITADNRDSMAFEVPVNALVSVSQLKIAIEEVQVKTSNRALYGNGVKDVYFTASEERIAPSNEYVCNLERSTADLPIQFSELAAPPPPTPKHFADEVATRVVAIYRTTRSETTLSERSTQRHASVRRSTAAIVAGVKASGGEI